MPPKKDDVQSTLSDLVKKIEDLTLQVTNSSAKQDDTARKLDSYLTKHDILEKQTKSIEKGLNELEQHGRSHSCRFFGLSTPQENCPFSTSRAVYKSILPILSIAVEEKILDCVPSLLECIDMSHKLPARDDDTEPPVLVRFRSKLVRLAILKSKSKYFKTSGAKFSIVEDLTRKNQALLKSTKARDDVQSCWVRNGRIFYKTKKEPSKTLQASL